MVIFDSQVPTYHGRAVYLSATATELAGRDLDRGLGIYPGPASRGATRVELADVTASVAVPPVPGDRHRGVRALPARAPAGVPAARHRGRSPHTRRSVAARGLSANDGFKTIRAAGSARPGRRRAASSTTPGPSAPDTPSGSSRSPPPSSTGTTASRRSSTRSAASRDWISVALLSTRMSRPGSASQRGDRLAGVPEDPGVLPGRLRLREGRRHDALLDRAQPTAEVAGPRIGRRVLGDPRPHAVEPDVVVAAHQGGAATAPDALEVLARCRPHRVLVEPGVVLGTFGSTGVSVDGDAALDHHSSFAHDPIRPARFSGVNATRSGTCSGAPAANSVDPGPSELFDSRRTPPT